MNNKWIFRVECFEVYGLDAQRNFLHECTLSLKTNKDLFEFMLSALQLHECPCCCICAIDMAGSMWCGIKTPQADKMELLVRKDFDLEFFAQTINAYGLTCYSLIIEVQNGKWKAVTR